MTRLLNRSLIHTPCIIPTLLLFFQHNMITRLVKAERNNLIRKKILLLKLHCIKNTDKYLEKYFVINDPVLVAPYEYVLVLVPSELIFETRSSNRTVHVLEPQPHINKIVCQVFIAIVLVRVEKNVT